MRVRVTFDIENEDGSDFQELYNDEILDHFRDALEDLVREERFEADDVENPDYEEPDDEDGDVGEDPTMSVKYRVRVWGPVEEVS